MSGTSEPLKKQRLVALALSWAWFVISACVGLNALIKFAHRLISMGSISHSLSLGATRHRHISGNSPPQASLSNFISMVPTSPFCHYLRLIFSLRRYLSTWCRSYVHLRSCGRHPLKVLHRHDHLATTRHQLAQDSSMDLNLFQCVASRHADSFYRFHGDPLWEGRRLS